MLTAIDAEEVRDRIRSDDCAKWDRTVPRDAISMVDGRVTIASVEDTDSTRALVPTTWATTQLCQRLGMPTAYFRRCPTELQDFQFNHWVLNADTRQDQWFLRAKGDSLRGVLSTRYSPMDNLQLMDTILPLLRDRYQVSWFALSDESLHLRLVDPQLAREVLPDDRLMVGLHLANSEVGLRAVTVDALVYRLVCTNGLIRLVKGKSLLHQRHVSLDQPTFVGALSEAMHQALAVAAGFIEQMIWATKEPVRDVDTTIATIGGTWNLSKATQDLIRLRLTNERASQQETLYGLANAITSAAQDLPADNRYDLEALAGRLVEQGVHRGTLQVVAEPPRREVIDLCA